MGEQKTMTDIMKLIGSHVQMFRGKEVTSTVVTNYIVADMAVCWVDGLCWCGVVLVWCSVMLRRCGVVSSCVGVVRCGVVLCNACRFGQGRVLRKFYDPA